MNQKELKELIEFLIEKDIAEFELERGDVKVKIKRAAEPPPLPDSRYFAVHPAPPPVLPTAPVPAAAPLTTEPAADAAFAKAAYVIKRRYVISRVYAHFMEPRGAIGVWDPGEDRYTLYADVQYPHRVR